MPETKIANRQKAGCLCNGVSFTAELNEDSFSACHCTMCRRWASGPFLAIHAQITEMQGSENVKAYKSSDWAERAFCKQCGTNLYYKITAQGPHQGATFISIGLLDNTEDLTLDREIFIDEKPAGYNFAGDIDRKTGAEFIAQMMKVRE